MNFIRGSGLPFHFKPKLQFSTCEVFFVFAIKAMTSKIKHMIRLLYDIVLAKFHFSRLERFSFMVIFPDP